MFVYIGTYTEPGMGTGEGVYLFDLDSESGALTHVRTFDDIANPSFLALGSGGDYLYAVNELDEGRLSSFSRDRTTGDLTLLNSQPTHGAHPCFVSIDQSGRYALITNYNGGSLAAFPIGSDGRLDPASSLITHTGTSINPDRQQQPHPHMIASTPDGEFLLATDLGSDELVLYRLDPSTGALHRDASTDTNPGAGPRHFSFSPDGKTLYVINELDSTISVFSYDRGQITHKQSLSTLPAEFKGASDCAQIVISPDGRFVYGSNRGHDSIAIFSVDPASGELSPIGHQSTLGQLPRNFNIDPSGEWLLVANQESDTIATFLRDQMSGLLSQSGQLITVPSAVAIIFA